MRIEPQDLSSARPRLWRRLTGAVVIYALVLQSLFFGFATAPAAALTSVDAGLPVFELCLNGHQDGPLSPADLPGHHGDNHCTFCFAGTHNSLAAPPQYPLAHPIIKAAGASWAMAIRLSPRPFQYSIAQPRGPPLSA
jgi:hypothetical protein